MASILVSLWSVAAQDREARRRTETSFVQAAAAMWRPHRRRRRQVFPSRSRRRRFLLVQPPLFFAAWSRAPSQGLPPQLRFGATASLGWLHAYAGPVRFDPGRGRCASESNNKNTPLAFGTSHAHRQVLLCCHELCLLISLMRSFLDWPMLWLAARHDTYPGALADLLKGLPGVVWSHIAASRCVPAHCDWNFLMDALGACLQHEA